MTAETELFLQDGCRVRLASLERGRELLGIPDAYTARLGPFDFQAKVRGAACRQQDYLEFAQRQVRAWTPSEERTMADNVAEVGRRLGELRLIVPFPPVIEVVKSTLEEEGGMRGYTRGCAVVLQQGVLDARTFAHELFHLLSRKEPRLRERLYRLLGVRVVSEIRLSPGLEQARITNPDAPKNDSVIVVRRRGRPILALMAILSEVPFRGGGLRPYLQPALVVIDERSGGRFEQRGGYPVLRLSDVEGLWDQLGTNTDYVLHPEEVSAEHFAMMLGGRQDLPRPDLVAGMWETLSAWRA